MGSVIGFTDPFGFRLEISGSFLGLFALLFVGIGVWNDDPSWALQVIGSIALAIYLHEIGHALAARWQKVPVSHILLYGGGGLCFTADAAPGKEVGIIAAGPAVNAALYLLAGLGVDGLCEALVVETSPRIVEGRLVMPDDWAIISALDTFAQMNLILFVINMIPVLPLDGGRLLFLGLWYRLSRPLAMRITGGVGFVVAILWYPAMLLVFISVGAVVLFFPSVRDNWQRLRGRKDL